MRRPPAVSFTSIKLDAQTSASEPTVLAGGASITLRLGVEPEPPVELYAHLYNEQSACPPLVLEADAMTHEAAEVVCSFTPPANLKKGRLCLVIEVDGLKVLLRVRRSSQQAANARFPPKADISQDHGLPLCS
jgi:hypothetical protein